MSADEIRGLIARAMREIVPGLEKHDFKETDSMEGLGANSVDRAEVVMMVLEQMDLRIPLVETVGPDNIGALALLLSEKSR